MRRPTLVGRIRAFSDNCQGAATLDDLDSRLHAFAASLGFRWFALTHVTDMTQGRYGTVRLTNYPDEWRRHYDVGSLYGNDPALQALEQSSQPLIWDRIRERITLTRTQEEILADAAYHGLCHGVSIPIRIPGEYQGAVSFASETPVADEDEMLIATSVAAPAAFEAARRILKQAQPLSARNLKPITHRQRDCLTLIAQGKSDWEAGQILGLSPDTVHGHVEAIRNRYGVRRRAQLIVRALYDGQLSFHEIL